MNFIKPYKTQYSPLWKTTLLFILVSALLIAADRLSIYFGLHGSQRIVDDLLGGLIAGSIFHLYERQRLRRFSEIDFMNLHIRNTLQPLMSVSYVPGEAAQMKLVEDCVRHIDWALREVLPAQPEPGCGSGIRRLMGQGGFRITPLTNPGSAIAPAKPFFSQWLDHWRARNQR